MIVVKQILFTFLRQTYKNWQLFFFNVRGIVKWKTYGGLPLGYLGQFGRRFIFLYESSGEKCEFEMTSLFCMRTGVHLED